MSGDLVPAAMRDEVAVLESRVSRAPPAGVMIRRGLVNRRPRRASIWALAALVTAVGGSVAAEPAATVTLRHAGRVDAPPAAQSRLLELGEALLKSSNFNTEKHARVMGQSAVDVDTRYRHVIAGDHIAIAYARTVTVKTVGGEVPVSRIVIGLGRPDYADALFTLDGAGRVVAHGKYSGGIAIRLREAVAAPPPAR